MSSRRHDQVTCPRAMPCCDAPARSAAPPRCCSTWSIRTCWWSPNPASATSRNASPRCAPRSPPGRGSRSTQRTASSPAVSPALMCSLSPRAPCNWLQSTPTPMPCPIGSHLAPEYRMPERQLHLNAFLMGVGHHEAAWRHPATDPRLLADVAHYQNLARIAERGTFDSVFLADGVQIWGDVAHTAAGGFEPLTLLTAIATVTDHI